MAFKLAEAYVQLSSRGLASVNRGLGSIRGSLAALISPAGMVAGAIAGIGGGLTVKSMITLAARAETLAVSFEVLLGSAEKAKQMVEDIGQFAARTPFEQGELGAVTKQLLAFGVVQERIIPTMQTLGDIAALSGARMSDLARIYGKAKGTGVVMTEVLDQFLERGIPLGRELAKVLGVAETEVRKLAPTGKITFGILEEALANLTKEGGQFYGGMQKLSKTTAGVWSTFTGNLKVSLGKIGGAMIDAFDVRAIAARLGQFAGTFWQRFGSKIKAAMDTVGVVVKSIVIGFRLLASAARETFGALMGSDLGGWLGDLGNRFAEFVGTVNSFMSVMLGNWTLTWELMKLMARDAIREMTGRMKAFFSGEEFQGGESARTHFLKMYFRAELEKAKRPPDQSAASGKQPANQPFAAARGPAGGFGITTLTGLTEQMQSEAGKRIAERTANATERTAAAVEQMAARTPQRAGTAAGVPVPAWS